LLVWASLAALAGGWLPGGVASGIGGFDDPSFGAVLLAAESIPAVLVPAEAELRVTTSGSQTDADHVRFYEKGRRCPYCLLRQIVGEQGDPVPAPSCSVLR